MWPFRRSSHNRRPEFERTADGRERIVLVRRRHSTGGHDRDRPHPRPERRSHDDTSDARDDRWRRGEYQQLAAENEGLRVDNMRLLRDNQNLSRSLRDVTADRDWQANQLRRRNLRAEALQQLEEGLEAEKRARRRVERQLRDEKDVRDRREAELVAQNRRLRNEDETGRARIVVLTRDIRDLFQAVKVKEDRIRALEEWIRRQGLRQIG